MNIKMERIRILKSKMKMLAFYTQIEKFLIIMLFKTWKLKTIIQKKSFNISQPPDLGGKEGVSKIYNFIYYWWVVESR